MDDWRITNQDKYLKDAVLQRLSYGSRTTKTDHDHCEFCVDRFSDNHGDLHVGYCTPGCYYWICEECYKDFNELFGWKLVKNDPTE